MKFGYDEADWDWKGGGGGGAKFPYLTSTKYITCIDANIEMFKDGKYLVFRTSCRNAHTLSKRYLGTQLKQD